MKGPPRAAACKRRKTVWKALYSPDTSIPSVDLSDDRHIIPVVYAYALFSNKVTRRRLAMSEAKKCGVNNLLVNGWGAAIFPNTAGWPEALSTRGEVPRKTLLVADCSSSHCMLAQSRGWVHVNLDYTTAYTIMATGAVDMQFAHEMAPKKLYERLVTQFRIELEKLGLKLSKSQTNL